MKDKKIAFLGTPEISAFLLKGLVENGFDVTMAITKEDKVRGRNNKVEESPVAAMARTLGIPCYKPHRLNKDHDFLLQTPVDLLLTFAYGQILSTEVLALGKYTPLNIHASLLPKYRGAAPIQYALRNGDETTGVTLMAMVKEMDAGDIYAQESLPIDPEDDYTTLSRKLAELALRMAVEKLPLFFEGRLGHVPQDSSKVTFCPTIKKEEEHLSLAKGAKAFVDAVRSLSQEPGGYLLLDGENIKVYKAHIVSGDILAPVGTVVKARKKEILLQASDGLVNLDVLQRPGKRAMETADFNNGFQLQGRILG